MQLASRITAYVLSLAAYPALLAGGVWLFMVAAEVVGYLPYSDRPGPGWVGWFPVRSLEGIREIASFALTFVVYCLPAAAVFGTFVVTAAWVLDWFRVPRWIIAVLAALAAALLNLILVAGTGWVISIGAATVWAAACLGLVYGACLLPRLLRLDLTVVTRAISGTCRSS